MPFAAEKPAVASKTIWVNAITTIIATLSLLAGEQWIAEYPKVTAAIIALIGALNIVLRFISVDVVKLFAVLLAVTFALSGGQAHARPVRVCDGTACRVVEEPTLAKKQARWFKAMPLPIIERNVVRWVFGR